MVELYEKLTIDIEQVISAIMLSSFLLKILLNFRCSHVVCNMLLQWLLILISILVSSYLLFVLNFSREIHLTIILFGVAFLGANFFMEKLCISHDNFMKWFISPNAEHNPLAGDAERNKNK